MDEFARRLAEETDRFEEEYLAERAEKPPLGWRRSHYVIEFEDGYPWATATMLEVAEIIAQSLTQTRGRTFRVSPRNERVQPPPQTEEATASMGE